MPFRLRVAFAWLSTFFLVPAAFAVEPIRYTIRFPEPQTHYVEVSATVPLDGQAHVELMIPVWTPGSYLVREYARHVESIVVKAADGKPLAVSKTRKNRWKVETGGTASLLVTYRVYGREMSVQTNWVDASFAILNGAATFLTLADSPSRPHEVIVVPAKNWNRVFCGLPDAPGGKPHHYLAADYDALVDSPIYAGNPTVHEFKVDGKPHYLVDEAEGGVWDGPRAAKDVEAIVKAQRDFWGSLPYDKYIFFNLLVENGGGLEHRNSTVLMSSRWGTRRRSDYLGWLGLVSHEYFHTWNVKRLRPIELGPFDYENEVVTKSLWIAEGLTSYYGALFVRRAGLCTDQEFFQGDPPNGPDGERAKGDIEKLQDTPGRGVQPLESASYDAWIKFYRRDENSLNTGISYYTKGSVVGFLIDAEIRRATDGKKSLDDVMRLAFQRYSGSKGYTPQEFRAIASEVAGTNLAPWFQKALETTDELDYAEALRWFGLRFASNEPKPDPDKAKEKKPDKAWSGLTVKPEEGRLTVSTVKRATPGLAAGFNVGDEILAIDDERVLASQWGRRMEQYRPGDTVSVLISRRGRLFPIKLVFGKEPITSWKLEIDPKADASQKARLRAWLGR